MLCHFVGGTAPPPYHRYEAVVYLIFLLEMVRRGRRTSYNLYHVTKISF